MTSSRRAVTGVRGSSHALLVGVDTACVPNSSTPRSERAERGMREPKIVCMWKETEWAMGVCVCVCVDSVGAALCDM